MKKIAALLILTISLLYGELTIMTEDYPPFNYLKNGKLEGLSVEVVEEIKKRLHIESKIELMPWARAYQTISVKDNHVLFSTTRTDAREPLFKWVGPIANDTIYFYKRKGSSVNIKSVHDAMKVESVCAYKSDITHQQMVLLGFENLDVTVKLKSCFEKIMIDRISLIPSGVEGVKMMREIGKSENDLENTGVKFMDQELYIAFSKSTPDFEIKRWQNALDEIKKEGLYKKIYDKYIKSTPL